MYDFEGLVNEVLRNKPDMTREEILGMIEDKKRDVGAGYLTDQGALFLIAGELGVQLKPLISDLTLKDLYLGANDITVVARILAVYPISEFKKKDGNGTGRYRRVNLFDQSGVVKLTIWDDNPDAMKLEGVKEDTPVRVSNGYVRPGMDGKATLNLGRRGRIEVIGDEKVVARMVSLSNLSKKVDSIGEEQNLLAVEGVASSNSRMSNFVREDGSPGSLMQFDVSGAGGKTGIRIVVWNPGSTPEVKVGQSVLVTNLRVKKAKTGEKELHGDTATAVRLLDADQPAAPAVLVKVSAVKSAPGPVNLEVMILSKGALVEVSTKDGSKAAKCEILLGDDTGEITVVGWRLSRGGASQVGRWSEGQNIRRQTSGIEGGNGDAGARVRFQD